MTNGLTLPAPGSSTVDSGKLVAKRDVAWASNYIKCEKEEIDWESAPSECAKALLDCARADPKWFFKEFVTKFLPNRAQLEAEERFSDDCGSIEEMINLVEAAARRSNDGELPNTTMPPPTIDRKPMPFSFEAVPGSRDVDPLPPAPLKPPGDEDWGPRV